MPYPHHSHPSLAFPFAFLLLSFCFPFAFLLRSKRMQKDAKGCKRMQKEKHGKGWDGKIILTPIFKPWFKKKRWGYTGDFSHPTLSLAFLLLSFCEAKGCKRM